ncbi:uncharacterized oxidoreductase [Sediminibacillus halophilus]|uniref:Uncharacterized oxidoreductase n=1 Tax=Sediminibacillus halophilus TaxID=482461 RepID=A0A1G9WYF4_9BACI|nr:iron-containing alcohol dehydrogenase family protein [Sediminibacillus halophilus]SDM89584.1 uncharacterized oxidoreductase [Sediminibacillus halophilus]
MSSIQVQGAPAIYHCYQGVLELLPEKIAEQQFSCGLLLHGEKSWKAAKRHFVDPGVPLTYLSYRHECTHEEAGRIGKTALKENSEFIIGLGGGKVLDLAKAAGNQTGLPVILIPTLASNCAAWTPLSVFYDQEGNFEEYVIFPRSTWMVLVEPNILIESPSSFLRAGIGDTIAKWYEADVLTRGLPTKAIPLEIALHAARLCRDTLLAEGSEALEAIKAGSVTESFNRTVETIIMAGGMVGGFGDHYGRISGAHSIHNGLTHLPETHSILHGDKVAYGILVQLALEGRPDEIKRLLPHYRELGLPTSLSDLGINPKRKDLIESIAAAATAPGESIHLMNITERDQVTTGIQQLEQWLEHATP